MNGKRETEEEKKKTAKSKKKNEHGKINRKREADGIAKHVQEGY